MSIFKNKNEKIPVDKSFLELALKTIGELQKRIEAIEGSSAKAAAIPPKGNSVFFSQETSFVLTPSVEEVAIRQNRILEFRQKLERLMREYKVSRIEAIIFSKLE